MNAVFFSSPCHPLSSSFCFQILGARSSILHIEVPLNRYAFWLGAVSEGLRCVSLTCHSAIRLLATVVDMGTAYDDGGLDIIHAEMDPSLKTAGTFAIAFGPVNLKLGLINLFSFMVS